MSSDEGVDHAMDALWAFVPPEIKEAQPISEAFPSEFERAWTLIKEEHPSVTRDELQDRLGKIVYQYRNRYSDSERARIHKAIDLAQQAANGIALLLNTIVQLDPDDRKLFEELLRFAQGGIGEKVEMNEVTERLYQIRSIVFILSRILGIVAGHGRSQRVGRPKIPYGAAAYELVALWKELTLRDAPYPKGLAPGKGKEREAEQPSTEFFRLALKMIDPKLTDANTMTCLKDVFSNKERYFELMRENRNGVADWLLAASRLDELSGPCELTELFVDSEKRWWIRRNFYPGRSEVRTFPWLPRGEGVIVGQNLGWVTDRGTNAMSSSRSKRSKR